MDVKNVENYIIENVFLMDNVYVQNNDFNNNVDKYIFCNQSSYAIVVICLANI